MYPLTARCSVNVQKIGLKNAVHSKIFAAELRLETRDRDMTHKRGT